MSIRAGHIVFVGGRNVIDRLQNAAITGNVPVETIREVGNDLVVDKVPGEPDFTFTMENWDVTTDMIAFLQGEVGTQTVDEPPGHGDAANTFYHWENCQFVNICSPWKDDTGSQGGHINSGVLIPGYYPTRLRYRLGVTENATQTVELRGGQFYYGPGCPVEETAAGDGATVAFVTSEDAIAHPLGEFDSTIFQRVWGVLVDGILQIKDVDYVESIGVADTGQNHVTTITFATAPANLSVVKFVYFTAVAKTYPQAVNADATIKPGAVRGRDIDVYVNGSKLPGTQSFELDATVAGNPERMMGLADITGYSVDGTDVTGNVVFRPKDRPAFFSALEEAIGVATDKISGYFYQHTVPVAIQIRNPKDPSEIIKTLYVANGRLQPPPPNARVNTATEFTMQFDAVDGTFAEIKGHAAP